MTILKWRTDKLWYTAGKYLFCTKGLNGKILFITENKLAEFNLR